MRFSIIPSNYFVVSFIEVIQGGKKNYVIYLYIDMNFLYKYFFVLV